MITYPSKHPTTEYNNEKKINVLLVDGNANFEFSIGGNKGDYNSKGHHVGGTITMIKIIKRLLSEITYNKAIVSWDSAFSGKYRSSIYAEYKENRGVRDYRFGTSSDPRKTAEINRTKQYLVELGLRFFENKYAETDDFLSYYCLSKPSNEHVVIATLDSDILQLINILNVSVYMINTKTYITKENFKKNYGFHPENIVNIKIIRGDSADNIQGVKGVQLKTLLTHFPELIERKVELNEIINKAKIINENRNNDKKSDLKAINNIANGVTNGTQKDLYAINKKLIDLSRPLINNRERREIDKLIFGVMEPDPNGMKNVINMLKQDKITPQFIPDYALEEFLTPFKKIIEREKITYKNFIENN